MAEQAELKISKYFLMGITEEASSKIGEYLEKQGIPKNVIQAIWNWGYLEGLIQEDPEKHMLDTKLPDDNRGVEGWNGEVVETVGSISHDLEWFFQEEKREREEQPQTIQA